jgi:putative ABC transport system substrate-binding protein
MAVFRQHNKVYRCSIALTALLLCLCSSFLIMNNARADQEVIAVIYPDISKFKDIFTEIISGIQRESTHNIIPYTLNDDFNPDDFRSWARALNVKVVIAIGNSGMNAADSVKGKIPIISNAFLVPDRKDDNMTGISLAVDPTVLVDTLSAVAPEVKRINVVYNPEISGWLINIAKTAATKHGLRLIAYEADDIRSATRLYAKILEQSKPTQDAIWLPQDRTTVNDEIILPMILKGAWNHSLVFISSIGSHAKNGALFSLYPDYAGLGASLAKMADKYIDNTSRIHTDIQPLEDLQFAVNIRTADHLNLDIDKSGIKFDLVFPTPKD